MKHSILRKATSHVTSRDRLLVTWSFREPDRVPVELENTEEVRRHPATRRLCEFADREADNFIFVAAADWGFFGLQAVSAEEVIEEARGRFVRKRLTYRTSVGDFCRITRHPCDVADPADFYWEQRFIRTREDMDRLASAPKSALRVLHREYAEADARVGSRGVPISGLAHPLGSLVRMADTESVYGWLATEPALIHRFLDRCYGQQVAVIEEMGRVGMRPSFITWAHEMLIPPWMSPRMFDEFVFPYDKRLNDAIHRIGGRMRMHCHGSCMNFLEKFADMGVDSIEPLEPSPYGDVDLADAKRRVGDRMLLSGNIPSQKFPFMSRKEVQECVKEAIAAAAGHGGFTLRTTGGGLGAGDLAEPALAGKMIENYEAFIDAALEYGTY